MPMAARRMGTGETFLPGSMLPASSQTQTSPTYQLFYQSWAGDTQLNLDLLPLPAPRLVR
jgi:hypothetical protein